MFTALSSQKPSEVIPKNWGVGGECLEQLMLVSALLTQRA